MPQPEIHPPASDSPEHRLAMLIAARVRKGVKVRVSMSVVDENNFTDLRNIRPLELAEKLDTSPKTIKTLFNTLYLRLCNLVEVLKAESSIKSLSKEDVNQLFDFYEEILDFILPPGTPVSDQALKAAQTLCLVMTPVQLKTLFSAEGVRALITDEKMRMRITDEFLEEHLTPKRLELCAGKKGTLEGRVLAVVHSALESSFTDDPVEALVLSDEKFDSFIAQILPSNYGSVLPAWIFNSIPPNARSLFVEGFKEMVDLSGGRERGMEGVDKRVNLAEQIIEWLRQFHLHQIYSKWMISMSKRAIDFSEFREQFQFRGKTTCNFFEVLLKNCIGPKSIVQERNTRVQSEVGQITPRCCIILKLKDAALSPEHYSLASNPDATLAQLKASLPPTLKPPILEEVCEDRIELVPDKLKAEQPDKKQNKNDEEPPDGSGAFMMF